MKGEAILAKVDSDASPQAASRFAIRSIPTLVLFRNGKEIKRAPADSQGALEAQPNGHVLVSQTATGRITEFDAKGDKVMDLKIDGLLAQVTLGIGDQKITSIITADAAREMRLAKGMVAAALVKSTEVMIVLPD